MTSLRHRTPALLCILLSIMVLWSARGFAQTPLSLSEAVSFALSHRPEIRAALDRTAAAEHLQKQAGLIPNPRIFLQSEDLRSSNFNFWQDSETFAYAAETLETSGRRAGRIATATQRLEGSRLQADQVRLQIALRVRQAYWRALATQRLAQLYREDNDYFRQIISYHDARFHEGKLAEVDLLRVRLEGERVHAAEARTQLESQRALFDLEREMASPDRADWRLTESFEALDPPSPAQPGVDPSLSRVEGQAAHQAIDAARASLQLQKASGRPDLEALAGYKRNLGDDTALVGLQWNLPIFDRNQGAVAAAAADIRAAEEDYLAVRQQLFAQLSIAQREYDVDREQYLQTFKPLRDQAVEISDISRAAYNEGGLDLVRLLDAERVRVEAEVSWVQALENYHQSVVSLEYAQGVRP
jgi:cobalt-zinc-cadmium efflux system outer membrane protein